MATCTSCGSNVSGKKFCPECGTPVQPAGGQAGMANCPRCQGEVRIGAAFCMHCGAALNATAQPVARATVPVPQTALVSCPACQAQVSASSAFCTSCGHDMRAPARATGSQFCTNCGRQNEPRVRFCGGCGSALSTAAQAGAYTNYSAPTNPTYTGQTPYQQGNYPQTGYMPSQLDQSPYAQSPYPQTGYSQQNQPVQYGQPGYQPQPMLGQQPMVLRCPTCMAMFPVGTAFCQSCRTSLAGVVPTPANMPMAGQQQGGFLQGNAGKFAIGALGGAAAVIGGEMLLHGIENRIEDNIRGDRDNDRGGLLDLADDIGLF